CYRRNIRLGHVLPRSFYYLQFSLCPLYHEKLSTTMFIVVSAGKSLFLALGEWYNAERIS
ncbi:MAG TPA: hypothetical protein VH593_25950, partial [Ktedonobacteraceae bacterium]